MTAPRDEETHDVEARLLRTLYELSVSAGRKLDPGELVKLVAEHAGELLHGDAVAVYLWDDTAGRLMPVYSNDSRQPVDDQPLRLGQGAAGQAVLRRELVVIDDYDQFAHSVAWARARRLKSIDAVPLMVGDRCIGALVIRFYAAPHVPGPDEERVLKLLAAQAAPALEAARLYATTTLQSEHERALREITQALAENLDERQVLDLAVRYSAELFRAPYARIWLREPSGELSCAAAEGFVHAETFNRHLAPDSTSGQVAASHHVVNLANAPAEPTWTFNREFGERTGLGAYLGAALWRAGESLGVLEIMRQAGYRFSEVEEQLLVSLANAVAVAVSNARTHAAVEQLAREAERRAQAVAESERVLRSVYAAIGSGVLVFDAAGIIIHANAAAEEILGRTAAALLGTTSRDARKTISEDGSPLPRDQRPVARAMRTRSAQRKVVLGIVRPDGSRRWLQVDAVPLFGPDGAITRVVASFIDITDQKRGQEALRRRDAILEAVAFAAEKLLTTPEWEHGIDDVLAQLGAASAVSRVYIVSAGEDQPDGGGVSLYQWTAAGVRPRANGLEGPYLAARGLGRWEAVLRAGGIVEGRLRSFPPDEQAMLAAQGVCSLVVVPIFVGSQWWGFIGFDDCEDERSWPASAVEVLKSAAGTIGAAILRRRAEAERLQLVREQSARVEAEAAQRRLGFLADASQILAASLDYENSLQGVADLIVPDLAAACFVDVLEQDGSLRRVASTLAADLDPASEPGVTQLIEGAVSRGESRLTPMTLTVPLLTRSGNAGAFTWVGSRRRSAFDVQDLDLADHIARRCALAIDNSRLYREARAAVNIRDEFLSVAAHELKTPMTSLRGYAQLLAREFEKGQVANAERARRAAVTIQVQSDKLARLVSQLLDVSRIQSGKLAIERKPSDLSALVRDVVQAVRGQLKEHTLVARLPTELWVSIDPLRIEQVVTNLIDNAIKYSPEGGHIDVVLRCDVDQQTVQLSVRDRGVGVPPEHRAHIFDRFYQAHAGGALTSMAGMGLGLYISRQIVELHGGTIRAEFPEDRGTRIVVTLPR
jgi:PAS domain S-box-containing protein